MHDPAHDYMVLLAEGAETEAAYGDYFAAQAFAVREGNEQGRADALIGLGRLHRVKELEMRAQLAALAERWGNLHLDGER